MRNKIFEGTVLDNSSKEYLEVSKFKLQKNIFNVTSLLTAAFSLFIYYLFGEKYELVGFISQFFFIASGVIFIVSYPIIAKDLKKLRKERFDKSFYFSDLNLERLISSLNKPIQIICENINSGKVESNLSVDDIHNRVEQLKKGEIEFDYANFGFIIEMVEKIEKQPC